MRSRLTVAIVVVLLALYQVLSAQEGCFPHETLYTSVPVEIRGSPEKQDNIVARTVARQPYAVVSYVQDDTGVCWVRTDQGWIRNTVLVRGSLQTEKNAASDDTALQIPEEIENEATVSGCYLDPEAYVIGTMNIRASATTSSDIVGKAKEGESFPVADSKQGDSWCWLKIERGWIAKTSIVVPRLNPDTSNEQQIRLPRIIGSDRFISQVKGALRLVREQAPSQYDYIVSPTDAIHMAPIGAPHNRSRAYMSQRKIVIGLDHAFYINEYGSRGTIHEQLLYLIGTLAHEACHIHIYDRGERLYPWQLREINEEELRCEKKARIAVRRTDPDNRTIFDERSKLIQLYQEKVRRYGG